MFKSIWSVFALSQPQLYPDLSQDDYSRYLQYVSEYGKSISTQEEFNFRAKIFKDKLNFINAYNSDPTNTHELGINHMSDRLPNERKKKFIKSMTSYNLQPSSMVNLQGETQNLLAEDTINWVDRGKVTPVKYTGVCQSDYAFVAVKVLESKYAIEHNVLYELSAQQVLDCSTSFRNYGCLGGFVDYAFIYFT